MAIPSRKALTRLSIVSGWMRLAASLLKYQVGQSRLPFRHLSRHDFVKQNVFSRIGDWVHLFLVESF